MSNEVSSDRSDATLHRENPPHRDAQSCATESCDAGSSVKRPSAAGNNAPTVGEKNAGNTVPVRSAPAGSPRIDSPFAGAPFAAAIEQSLALACDFGPGCPDRLGDAIRYALLAPGKRLRPQLVCMAASLADPHLDWNDADSPKRRRVLAAAVAVEMIHAYSLIHDDLPAMDNDDLRRGRPTVHVQFDPATAILAGDALQPAAFGILASQIDDAAISRHCIAVLAGAAGPAALVGGQSDDLAAEREGESGGGGLPRTAEFLESIHRRKTGALFEAAVHLGCITGSADDATTASLATYARCLGLAFQVMDDYLDATADDQTLGKSAGKDDRSGKLTYVEQLGIDATLAKAVDLVQQAKSSLVDVAGDTTPLARLADFVSARSH